MNEKTHEETKVVYTSQPGAQTDFMQASETEVFFGGEAGGGKSAALVLDAMRYIKEPNYKAIIFRRFKDDLSDLVDFAREIYVPCGAREVGNAFFWENGAFIKFEALHNSKAIYKHQGKEYDYIGFDELPQFPKLAYTYLFSRLRGKNPNIIRYMRSTGNPDGEGVLWVKARFIDPLPPNTRGYFKTIMDRDTKVSSTTPHAVSRKFIPCVRAENKILMDADPEYESRLNMLSEEKQRALKLGLWVFMDKVDQLITTESWEKALDGSNKFVDDGNFTIGADYGTYQGVDKSVEVLGIGNRPYRVRSWPTTKTTHLAQLLAGTVSDVASSRVRIGVDCIGPGCGVGDDLEEHHNLGRILERCTHKDLVFEEIMRKQRYLGAVEFDNLRSAMCWKFKMDMDAGNIDLSMFTTEAGYFDDFNLLQEEVLAHTFRIYLGKLIVISKEELRKPDKLGRSPDFFDALVIWNWTRRLHYKKTEGPEGEYDIDEYTRQDWYRQNKGTNDKAAYNDHVVDQGVYND